MSYGLLKVIRLPCCYITDSQYFKVFEMVLLTVCEPVLESDSLQFSFKHNVGCNDAIFSLKSVIKYFPKCLKWCC